MSNTRRFVLIGLLLTAMLFSIAVWVSAHNLTAKFSIQGLILFAFTVFVAEEVKE